ncbi:MAG: PrgI family protein [bacterium]
MQFKVPQFLDIEDKIFGPFTFREFVYLAGGAGLCFVLYKVLGLLLGAIPILAIAGLSLALTFYHPNGKPFINLIESGLKYLVQDKLFIWKRKTIKASKKEQQKNISQTQTPTINHINPRLTGSKLRDLAWSLDVLSFKKEEKES